MGFNWLIDFRKLLNRDGIMAAHLHKEGEQFFNSNVCTVQIYVERGPRVILLTHLNIQKLIRTHLSRSQIDNSFQGLKEKSEVAVRIKRLGQLLQYVSGSKPVETCIPCQSPLLLSTASHLNPK